MADFIPARVKPIAAAVALDALDIRVGTIERVEEIPRSNKLKKLTVNFGDHYERFSPGSRKNAKNRGRSKDGRRFSS